MGHQADHVIDRGWRGHSDDQIMQHIRDESFDALLATNKFKKGPDRRAALTGMTRGVRIIRVTARGLDRQQKALELHLNGVLVRFANDPDIRRATLMNDLRVSYESVHQIRRKLQQGT